VTKSIFEYDHVGVLTIKDEYEDTDCKTPVGKNPLNSPFECFERLIKLFYSFRGSFFWPR